MTVTHHERRRDWDRELRFTVGVLSLYGSLALGLLAITLAGFLGDTNKALVTALMAFSAVYAAVAGYLGYRLAMRSWAWWSVWVAAALVIVPAALIRAVVYVLER